MLMEFVWVDVMSVVPVMVELWVSLMVLFVSHVVWLLVVMLSVSHNWNLVVCFVVLIIVMEVTVIVLFIMMVVMVVIIMVVVMLNNMVGWVVCFWVPVLPVLGVVVLNGMSIVEVVLVRRMVFMSTNFMMDWCWCMMDWCWLVMDWSVSIWVGSGVNWDWMCGSMSCGMGGWSCMWCWCMGDWVSGGVNWSMGISKVCIDVISKLTVSVVRSVGVVVILSNVAVLLVVCIVFMRIMSVCWVSSVPFVGFVVWRFVSMSMHGVEFMLSRLMVSEAVVVIMMIHWLHLQHEVAA